MVHDDNECLCFVCAFLDIYVIVRWMIEARCCLLQAELDVTYIC